MHLPTQKVSPVLQHVMCVAWPGHRKNVVCFVHPIVQPSWPVLRQEMHTVPRLTLCRPTSSWSCQDCVLDTAQLVHQTASWSDTRITTSLQGSTRQGHTVSRSTILGLPMWESHPHDRMIRQRKKKTERLKDTNTDTQRSRTSKSLATKVMKQCQSWKQRKTLTPNLPIKL